MGGALILISLVGIVVYFIPTFVAFDKDHKDKTAIIIINIFLGWSLIGWILSLVWAIKSDGETRVKKPTDDLQQLADLRKNGYISEAEFEQKKKELFDHENKNPS